MKNNLRFSVYGVFFIPVFFFFVFVSNNWIFGADARYLIYNYTMYSYHTVLLANLFVVFVWFSVLLSFSFVNTKKQSWLFIGSLFMLNLFNIRLLMPDLDNWVFILGSIPFIIYFKNNPIRISNFKITNITVGFASVVLYSLYRGFVFVNNSHVSDMTWNPSVFFMFIPSFYMLFRERKYGYLSFIIISLLLFTSGKYAAVALPMLVYSLYVDFMSSDYDYCRDRIMRKIILVSLVAFFSVPLIEMAHPIYHY